MHSDNNNQNSGSRAERLKSQLQALLGEKKVHTGAEILSSRNHDYWLLDLQRRLHGEQGPLPLCVVQPESHAEVAAVVTFASRESLEVVPYGRGSGVCGGARPRNGALVLDLSNMSGILEINETNLTVTVQPGMLGSEFEEELNKRGYSMGHFPQSIALSSVGGWVATRASGQYSAKYGSIEDMLVCFKGVLADGSTIATKNIPRAAVGPDVNELILGSEGTLVVLTEVTFRIHTLPEKQTFAAFQFPTMRQGLEAIRLIRRAGWKPCLTRLYDGVETQRHFGGGHDIPNPFNAMKEHKDGCMLLLASEGPAALADVEIAECSKIAELAGGTARGEGPVKHWLKVRFRIPNLVELAQDKGVVFDTIEVAANWDKVADLYDAVIASLKTVPGLMVASAHSSHSYDQGACLYFTFAVKKPYWLLRQVARRVTFKRYDGFASAGDAKVVERTYNDCWTKVMEATLANAGTISHHHGVGKVRLPWMKQEHALSYQVLLKVKKALDPENVLNPGTLFTE